jgi:thymidylate synthase
MDKFWVETLLQIDIEGNRLDSRNGWSSEVIGFSNTLKNIKANFLFNNIRRLDPHYACAEFLWYLSMTDDTTFLQLFAPQYKRFTEDGVHAFGAYGHRWVNNPGIKHMTDSQLELVIETLRKYPESRQAVITMWDSGDLSHACLVDKKDLPCTLSLQFLLRDGYLHQVATMRSNDAWLGLPYDVFCFTQLQKLIANQLDVNVGTYTHNAGSMHIYDKNKEKIDTILDKSKEELFAVQPEDDYRKAITDLSLKEQISKAIEFVTNASKDIVKEENVQEMKIFDSTIGDSALICASKFESNLMDIVYSPQLRKAVEVFYGKS